MTVFVLPLAVLRLAGVDRGAEALAGHTAMFFGEALVHVLPRAIDAKKLDQPGAIDAEKKRLEPAVTDRRFEPNDSTGAIRRVPSFGDMRQLSWGRGRGSGISLFRKLALGSPLASTRLI